MTIKDFSMIALQKVVCRLQMMLRTAGWCNTSTLLCTPQNCPFCSAPAEIGGTQNSVLFSDQRQVGELLNIAEFEAMFWWLCCIPQTGLQSN